MITPKLFGVKEHTFIPLQVLWIEMQPGQLPGTGTPPWTYPGVSWACTMPKLDQERAEAATFTKEAEQGLSHRLLTEGLRSSLMDDQ